MEIKELFYSVVVGVTLLAQAALVSNALSHDETRDKLAEVRVQLSESRAAQKRAEEAYTQLIKRGELCPR